jgi:hypothetical protein
MAPAQERLEAADALALEVIDRLIMQLELILGERLAQVGLEPAACTRASIPASKNRQTPRASALARCSASSAFLRSRSAKAPSAGASEMPMLTEIVTPCPSSS